MVNIEMTKEQAEWLAHYVEAHIESESKFSEYDEFTKSDKELYNKLIEASR